MKILFVHGYMFNIQTWSRAKALLKNTGIELHLFSQMQSAEKALAFMETEPVDIFIGNLFHDLPMRDSLLKSAEKAKMRAGVGWDMPPDFSTFSETDILRFNQFLARISAENYADGIRYLAACAGMAIGWQNPQPVQTHGIHHPEASELFSSVAAYMQWYAGRAEKAGTGPVIGVTCYYGQIVENNRDDIDALIQSIEANGMIPLCVCSEGGRDAALPLPERYPWLSYFKESQTENGPGLRAMMNLMAGRLLATPADAFVLQELNVPIFQMIRLHQQTPEQWAQDTGGMGSGFAMVYGLTQPEMAGVIEPGMAAGGVSERDSSMDIDIRRYTPVPERIEHMCRRLKSWLRLQDLANSEKRVTIVLNNNPCKGVEATLGVAAGLDTFESLAAVIRAMREAGYNVGDAPENGRELLNRFLEQKAVSEFRWTTVDEIVNKGGALHLMDREEYQPWFDTLPEAARKKLLEDWDVFPGQGMVYQEKGKGVLVITGLEFGNLKLMIQPKRGCYGPKCNGEVCRILHDPELSPPHHWLAVYHYIHKTSDVMIHFGTHGALEFLPGKRAALSAACFPEITLGDLPNLYVYVMDVPGDGAVAKRRGRAVMVDHLTPVYSPATLDDTLLELERLAGEHLNARDNREIGKTQTLPTGRNFFPTDVQTLPTAAAWEAGQTLANNLLEKYIREEGRFPESVGVSLWSIDAFKSDGEVFCQILYLMGMKPVWEQTGRVTKIEALAPEALSLTVDGKTYCPRPRIDVVIQTSGILRDMVPHFADLADEAAVMAAGLEESHALNFIRKHSDERMAELREELGDRFTESEMARMASFRVFSSAPGTYGIGVGLALDASAWEDEADLAETHVNWGGYAYGSSRADDFSQVSGREAHRIYAANLKTVEVSYMRQYSPEYDLLDCGGYAGFLGGMAVAAKAVGGKASRIYWADVNAAGDLSVRDVKEDIETSAHARLLNKDWIANQKKHGYKGAGGVSSRVNNLFKWSATTGKVEKWLYDAVVETYIHDRKNLEWLRNENPYALEELTRRLLEAESRGLWEADPETLEAIRQAALIVEGDMEEIMGEVQEEFQGSKIDVMTAAQVEKWQPKWRLKEQTK